MPIFTSNRISYGESVAADTRYTENDMGRIMQECAINDMKIFNAALARDFKEISAKQEGTMLESELKAFQEFSIKEAWKSLKEKVKKLWTKIKGVFKNVYAKLTVFLVRSNKTFITMHKKELLSKNCSDCKIKNYRDVKSGVNYDDIVSGFDTRIESTKKVLEMIEKLDPSSDAFIEKAKTLPTDKEATTVQDLYDKAMESFEDKNENLTFGKCNAYSGSVTKLMNNLSTSSSALKGLKEQNKKIDKKFKTILNKIDKAQSKAEKDKNEDLSKAYQNANKYASYSQRTLNATVGACIKLAKFCIKNDRGLIATLVAYNPKAKNESAYLESAFVEGFDRLYLETDDMEPEDVEAAAEEEGVSIEITVDGEADVEVNDETGE